MTLTQSGEAVSGSGTFQVTGGSAQPFAISVGHLADSALYAAVTSSATACTGTLQGSYRRTESDAGKFTATFACGVTISVPLVRE